MKRAAEIVHADSFIEKMPGGYDAPVTERGSTLSAGQRQLLSFARTLAYDPTILVLDEATANIDTETDPACRQDHCHASGTDQGSRHPSGTSRPERTVPEIVRSAACGSVAVQFL